MIIYKHFIIIKIRNFILLFTNNLIIFAQNKKDLTKMTREFKKEGMC